MSRYFVHSVSTRVLEVRYSCYYILLIIIIVCCNSRLPTFNSCIVGSTHVVYDVTLCHTVLLLSSLQVLVDGAMIKSTQLFDDELSLSDLKVCVVGVVN